MAKGGRGGKSVQREGGGGLKIDDILSTTDLMSERERRGRAVDETMQTFKEVNEEYGTIVSNIEVARIKASSKAMAYYDSDGNIAINDKYFDADKMNKTYDKTIESGYHPSRGNKTGLQAVTAHELGHKLTADIAVKMGKDGVLDFNHVATQVVNEARKKTSHKGVVQMASKISKYATVNNAEAIAEAFSDVYCNGKKANAESKAIVEVMNSYLK